MSHGGGGGFGHSGHGGHGGHHHVHSGGHPDQLPSWNMAMQAEKGGWLSFFKRINTRNMALPFLLFFGAFVWLFILYNIHHGDAVRDHTDVIDFRQRQNALMDERNQPGRDSPPLSAPLPASSMPAYSAGYPSTSSYGQQQAASPAYPQSANFSRGEFGVPRAADPAQQPLALWQYPPPQAYPPPGFNANSAMVAPITMRHAVGIEPGQPASRQRLMVNR